MLSLGLIVLTLVVALVYQDIIRPSTDGVLRKP
jgi:hypothetical protein